MDTTELFDSLENKYNLPSGLLNAIWGAESGNGKYMKSPKGAIGHFGFMPATAKEYGVKNPNDIQQSATGAAKYLSDLYRQFGDWTNSIAAYNAGSKAVKKYGGVPPYKETQKYVAKVTKNVSRETPPNPMPYQANPAMPIPAALSPPPSIPLGTPAMLNQNPQNILALLQSLQQFRGQG